MRIRPMTDEDTLVVERLTAAAFFELDQATVRPPGWPGPQLRSGGRAERWVVRMRHLVAHDGPGCWVAETDGEIVGAVAALLRDGMWGLSAFAVRPDRQGQGIGRPLLQAALGHGPWRAGLICSSSDPRAVHRYRSAGFELHPAREFRGPVPRAVIPRVAGARVGGPGDLDLLDAVDRVARGFRHGVDHQLLVEQLPLVVVERGSSRGYAYHLPDGSPYLVAGTDDAAASGALWSALAASSPGEPVGVSEVTGHQTWAVEIARAARLESAECGYVGVRGMPAPRPYLPCGHFL